METVPTNECNPDAYRMQKAAEFTDWFIAADMPPVYTGFYECVYDGDKDINSVMRWFDATTGKYYCVNEITGEAMLQRQACFGWGQDKWRGLALIPDTGLGSPRNW